MGRRMRAMDDEEATTKPTLETVVEMLKTLQLDVAEIKAEQNREARQIDAMAKDMYRFAGDLYELRLDFREFRETVLGSSPQIGK